MLMIDSLINDRYRIDDQVGSGGMADVYKAYDMQEKRYVAFKVIKSDYCKDECYVNRFEMEAKTALDLECKNIAKAYEFGRFIDENGDSRAYIAFEFVDGSSLKESLKAQGAINPKIAVRITLSVLEALECVHNAGYIHRDVKPQNVLISTDKSVKLTDFGIAKNVNSNTQTFESKDVLGSVHYISPEQANGEKVTAASDIYSVGILLYEMLVGKPPFDGDSALNIAMKHVTEEIIPPRTVNAEIPPALNDVVMKATAKHPHDRYESAQAMKDDLLKAIARPKRRLISASDAVKAGAHDQKSRRSKGLRHVIVPVAAAAALVLSVFAFWYVIVQSSEASSNVRIPELYGKTLEQAEQLLYGKGLKLVIGGYDYSDEYTADTICKQEPLPGNSGEAGDHVTVVISRGSETVVMIDLKGLTLDEAKRRLAEYNITVRSITYVLSDAEPDTIVRQSIVAGSEVMRGDEIDVEICSASSEKDDKQ